MVLLSKGKEVGKGIVNQSLPHEKLHGRDLPRGTLGVAVQLASSPLLMLPHVLSIEDDIRTLGDALGIVVACPIRELAKGQQTVPSKARDLVHIAPRATSVASGASPKPNVLKPLSKTVNVEGRNLRSPKEKDVVIEETHNEEEEEDPEQQYPRQSDGECPSKFEEDEDESDVPLSLTAKTSRVPQPTHASP
ncbi:hypothetical protein L7F22_021232 [Adiantum nelumboides]|nr:hypothetical protein [Adiantum nelumboides]